MKVTQNVIMDLLPVYFTGEASPDTKDLIEDFVRENPEVSAAVEQQRREFSGQRKLFESAGTPSADHELRTLARTRSLMERQKWSMAFALMLSAFPFSFVFSGSHLTFVLMRDQPLLAALLWCGAAILWAQYFLARRRLREKGF